MSVVVRRNMSVVTLVVARSRAATVLGRLFADGIPHALLGGARGTLIQDKWYQSLLPMISPELEVVQMVVPDPEVDGVMERAVRHAELHRSGAGAVYSTPCDLLQATPGFPLWPLSHEERPDEDASTSLKENLTAIHYISQGERTDAICRAAMSVGSHGPMVQYSEGRGLRDRLGWLRITSKPIKEVVTVVVDNVDANLVLTVMAEAGLVERPGHGLIYAMPIQKGLVNIDSVYSETRHSASIQQIIRAIDELKGGKAWRDQNAVSALGGQSAGLTFVARTATQRVRSSQARLTIVVARRQAPAVAASVMDLGAPGVNIDYQQLHQAADARDEARTREQHEELAHVRIIAGTEALHSLRERFLETADMPMMVYIQRVGQALSYEAPREEKPVRRYRGAPVQQPRG